MYKPTNNANSQGENCPFTFIKFPILDFFPSFLGECISKTFLFLSFLNSWQEKCHPLLIIIGLVNKNPTIL